MNGGELLHLRAAHAYAAKVDPPWGKRSVDWFRRWLVACAETEKTLIVRLTPGKTAPLYVRKKVLAKILDADDSGTEYDIESLKIRVQKLEEDVFCIRKNRYTPQRS